MERQKGRFKAAERSVELSNRSLRRAGPGKTKGADEQVKGQLDQFDGQRQNAREVPNGAGMGYELASSWDLKPHLK
jgi:hypothetical protein